MKKNNGIIVLLFIFLVLPTFLTAQQITLPSGSQKATVIQQIGLTEMRIDYNRPAVKGRKIWDGLVPYGQVWRAGADNNTVISFSTNVKIEGKDLAAGKYGFHVIPTADSWTLIFSKNYTSWGSFFYKEEEDALRVNVKPEATTESEEYLTYQFLNPKENKVTISLSWEKLKASFNVEIDLAQTVLANVRNELRNTPGFTWEGPYMAAQFCYANNTNLDEAMEWINASVATQATFSNLQLQSQLLAKAGKTTEADAAMQKALSVATVLEMHQYGRQLLAQKKNKEALEIFKANAKKNPDTWPVHVGLGRGYAANGDNANAIKEFKLALKQAPDENNKKNLENMIKNLEENKPIN